MKRTKITLVVAFNILLIIIFTLGLITGINEVSKRAEHTHYDLCMETERFSATEYKFIANELYRDMWKVR